MKLIWNGHACFTIETAQGSVVLDPYADNYVPGLAPLNVSADLVLCSHGHGDHNAKSVVKLTGGTPWTREQFYEKMWDDPSIPEDGIFFAVTPEGLIFSTATVQVREGHIGNLHMVGSSSDVRGLGGGRAVCTAVVEYFRKHEIKLAHLSTDDFRKPAIKIYFDLGYRPWLYEPDMAERWHALMDYYGIDELEAYDEDLNDLTMYSKKFEDR